jgi:hypothetical protein
VNLDSIPPNIKHNSNLDIMGHKTNISTSIKFSFNPIIVRQLTFSLGNMYNNIMNRREMKQALKITIVVIHQL